MSQKGQNDKDGTDAMNKVVAALKTGAGLKDDFIYYMSFDDYKSFPDPFPRTSVNVKEVQQTVDDMPIRKSPASCFRGTFTAGYLPRPKYRFPTPPW